MSMKKSIIPLLVSLFIIGCKDNTVNESPIQKPPIGEFLDDWSFKVNQTSGEVAEFRLWVPDSIDNINAVLILLDGANSNGLRLASSSYWQAYAKQEKLALVGVYLRNASYILASEGSGDALLLALDTLTQVHDLTYINSLPFLLRGYSAGGVFSYYFSDFQPSRVLAYANLRGGGVRSDAYSNYHVPGIMIIGDQDIQSRIDGIARTVGHNRKEGALQSYAIRPNDEHFSSLIDSDEVVKSFFSIALSKRLSSNSNELVTIPESNGWLGNNNTKEVFQFDSYPDSKEDASWLISEEFAKQWRGFQNN